MRYSLMQRIFTVEIYIRKKSSEKCLGQLRIQIFGVPVFSESYMSES
jgi:hypothetical protein